MARVDKADFIKSLTEEQFNAGCIKFNIPDDEDLSHTTAEGVWGWVTQEDKEKYNDDNFTGTIKAILLNQPLNFFSRLKWGTEVVIRGKGRGRPCLDPAWIEKELLTWEPVPEEDEE